MSFENYDPCFPDQPVVDQYLPVWANLPSFRSKPAFIWAEDGSSSSLNCSTLTYEGLNNSVHSISSQLLLSYQRGDTLVILCSPGLELVEILFGCQRAGLKGVPIIPPNPNFSNDDHHHLIRVLSQTRPKAAIAEQCYIEKVQRYIKVSSPENHLSNLLRNLSWISMENLLETNVGWDKSIRLSYQGCKPDEVYLVQYTSGATGIPKPVLVTAGAAAHNVRVARKSYDLHPNSIIMSWLPQYHDCGLMFLLLTIISGATCVLTSPNAFIKRPRIWLELITKFKATCTPVPSFTLPLVIKRGQVFNRKHLPINLNTMKNLIIINEPIYHEAIKQFVEVFSPFGLNPSSISPSYGLAENCTFVSTAWRSKMQGSHFPIHNKLIPSARLQYDEVDDEEGQINLAIVNEETNELVEDGVEGEIWIASSPSNASGYLNHPSLTQEVFQSRLKGNFSHERFIRTGDRGIIKGTERFLFVTGRCSDMIKHENGVETHAHFLETSAYELCTRFLRGGCIAAFEIHGTMIAIIAEMQKSDEKDESMLRKISEGIRVFVMKEEGIQVEMVVLVKSGSIPKTTSGKIQRWLAKDRFLRGKMDVVMEMNFDKEDDKNFKKSSEKNIMIDQSKSGKMGSQPVKTVKIISSLKAHKLISHGCEGFLVSIRNTLLDGPQIESHPPHLGRGTPASIVCDRDPRFTSRFWKGFQNKWVTRLRFSTVFHPQTDEQSERTIRTLKDMLRACTLNWKGNWDEYLCLVEFAYNNSLKASIGMAPFELLHGRTCKTLTCWNEFGEKVIEGPKLLRVTNEKAAIATKRLKEVQSQKKLYVDRHRRVLEFNDIFLKVSPW